VKQIERLDTIISGIEEITATLVTKIRLQDEHTVADVKTLNDISKINFDRKQLLAGKATQRIEISDYSSLTGRELEDARKQLID